MQRWKLTKTLRISEDLSLPLDAVTRRMAILAMSGAGKSNLAVVLAEAMFDAGIPWVAIDPKGDWWGVRSSGSGKGPGLPIPIFGGLHGDVPLEPTAGHLIADLIINQRLTCVLDVSEFATRQQMWAFLHDFGERVLHENREALHLFLEEADEYIPQKPGEKGNLVKCKGTWQRVVKRGRFRGLGSTQITQRSASLDKDTLYQAEVLFALRAAGKGDKAAIEGWVEYHNAAAEIVDSLPTLADGEGWVSSPAYLKTTMRVQIYRRRTFDSGATPVLLKGTMKPATLADIDLAAINTKMAATIEKAKATDPKELIKTIVELRNEIRALEKKPGAPAPPAVKIETKTVEKKVVIEGTVTRLEKLYADMAVPAERLETLIERAHQERSHIKIALEDARKINEPFQAPPALKPFGRVEGPVSVKLSRLNSATGAHSMGMARPTSVTLSPPRAAASSNGSGELSPLHRQILNGIALLHNIGEPEPTIAQVGAVIGKSHNAGRIRGGFNQVHEMGYAEISGNKISLTPTGNSEAVALDIRSRADIHSLWYQRLKGNELEFLRVLINNFPDSVRLSELGTAIGKDINAGRIRGALNALFEKGLATLDGDAVTASSLLFPPGLS